MKFKHLHVCICAFQTGFLYCSGMSYLLITSREKFIFEPMSVIDIETTPNDIEFLRSESKRFDTRYAGEADGSINKCEISLRFCLYMQSVVRAEFRHWPSHNRPFIGVTPCRLKMYLSDSFGRLHTR